MESANIEKIIDLLNDYIREYEEKEKYNEILITQSQLYKELLSLIDKDYKILDNNKLFISVLLSAIYNDDSLTNNFYNAMHALNNGNELPYLQFVAKINFDAKEINKAISNNTRELANSKKILKTAKKSIFYLKNRRPLYDYGFIFSNIKRIINYYATKGDLSAKEEIMLCNDLDCYNRLIISKRNEQKEYSEKIHNEIPNILNGGFQMYDDIDISVSRKQRLNKLVDEIKLFESDIPNKELIESGIRVGKDVIGTTINTLLFAYFGESLLLLSYLKMRNDSLEFLLNSKILFQSCASMLLGAIACVLVLPISTVLLAKMSTIKNIEKGENEI